MVSKLGMRALEVMLPEKEENDEDDADDEECDNVRGVPSGDNTVAEHKHD